MFKKPAYLLVSALAVVLIAAGVALFSGPAEAEAGNRYDIVFVRCDVKSGFGVQAYNGSAAAPSRKSDNCAETISVLNRDGFAVEQVSKFDVDKGFLVYMLVR